MIDKIRPSELHLAIDAFNAITLAFAERHAAEADHTPTTAPPLFDDTNIVPTSGKPIMSIPKIYQAAWANGDKEACAEYDRNLDRCRESERRDQRRWFDWMLD